MDLGNPRLLGIALIAGAALAAAGCGERSSFDPKVERGASAVANATGNATAQMADSFDDAAITARVKIALASDLGLKSVKLKVDTERGVVRLSGEVESNTQRVRALLAAAAVDGVKDVVNNVIIKTTA
jgi:hyperosmotically inducible protein